MMRASSFEYFAPRSAVEASQLLADHPGAMLLAGGTDLVPNMKRRQQTPPVVVSLRRIAELRGVRVGGDGALSIGACATLTDVVESGPINAHYRALWRAAAQIATPHLRNAGTIGGNLCLDTRCNYYNQNLEWRKSIDFCMKAPGPDGTAKVEKDGGICWVALSSPKCKAVSSSDTAPALIALEAQVTLSSAQGDRRIPLAELYADDGMAFLTKRPDEVLSAVHLPSYDGWKSTYWKLRRRGSFDFPVLGVAAAIRFGRDDVVEEARVVLGAVASRPVVVPSASLVGRPLTDDAIEAFQQSAARFAKPLDNTDFDLHWRKRVSRAYLTGVLKELRGDDPATLGLLARRAVSLAPIG